VDPGPSARVGDRRLASVTIGSMDALEARPDSFGAGLSNWGSIHPVRVMAENEPFPWGILRNAVPYVTEHLKRLCP
jgi:hypothetical protein